MDLVKIGFQINANGLKDANNEVDKLLGKVSRISAKPLTLKVKVDSSLQTVKKTLSDVEKIKNNLSTLNIKVIMVGYSQIKANLEKLEALKKSVKDIQVRFTMIGNVNKIRDDFSKLKNKTITVKVHTSTAQLDNLKKKLNSIRDKTVKLNINLPKASDVEKLGKALAKLTSKKVKIEITITPDLTIVKEYANAIDRIRSGRSTNNINLGGAGGSGGGRHSAGAFDQVLGIAKYALLSTAIYGVITGLKDLAVSFVETVDEVTNLTQRLGIYLPANIKVNKVMEQLGDIAKENRTALADSGKLFTQLLPPINRIKGGVAETIAVVDAFGKAMLIGGVNTQEAASATIQFGQAMASGKLAGDEFRSLAEASPRLLQAIADGSGIAAQKLKEMSAAGKLTSGLVSSALLDQFIQLEYEALKMGQTVSGAFNEGLVAYQNFIQSFNQQTGFTDSIVAGIRSIVKAFESLGSGLLSNLKDADSTLNSFLNMLSVIWDLLGSIVSGFTDVVGWVVKGGEKIGFWKATFDAVKTSLIVMTDTLLKIPFVIVNIGTRLTELVLKPFGYFISLAQKGLNLAGFTKAADRLGEGLGNYRGAIKDIKGFTGEVVIGFDLLSLGVKKTEESTGSVSDIVDRLKQQNKDLVLQEQEKKAMTDSQYISEYAKLLLEKEGIVANAENLKLVKEELKQRFDITQEQSKALKIQGEIQAKKDEAEKKAKEAADKAEKDAENELKRLEDVRKNYQDQIDIVERLNMFKAKGVNYDVAKIAAEKDYYDAYTDTAKALEVAEAKKALSRFDMLGDLENETLLLTKVLALQEQGVSYDVARSLAQAGFAANSEGLLAASQSMHNTLVAQQYSIADQIKQQTLLNYFLSQGLSLEEATVRASYARLENIQKEAGLKGLSTEQRRLRAETVSMQKQLEAKKALSDVEEKINALNKERAFLTAATMGVYTAATISAAKLLATTEGLLYTDAQRQLIRQEENDLLNERIKNQLSLNSLLSGESETLRDVKNTYLFITDEEAKRIEANRKLVTLAEAYASKMVQQKTLPIGDFSNVNFDVFGDIGNPFKEALDGLNAFVSGNTKLTESLSLVAEQIESLKSQAFVEEMFGNTDAANALTKQIEGQVNLEKDLQKQKEETNDIAYGQGLKLAKAFFKEGSKGYKVVSALEMALQAKKIAFAIWEKKDDAMKLASKLAGYAKDMVAFIAGVTTKIGAQMGLNVVEAQGAVASAANAPPPVGFASAAAMIALLAGIGIAISGGGGGSYVDTSNQGTGTVFGDKEAKSESIKNSIDLLSENSDLMLPLTSAMLASLKNIESSIGGVTNLVIRNAVGSKLADGVNQGFSPNLLGKVLSNSTVGVLGGSAMGALAIAGPIGLAVGAILGPMLGKVLGGLFGTKTTIKGQGLYGEDQKLGNILSEGFNLQEYVDVQTKKKAFGITTSTKNKTIYDDANEELSNQFTLIFGGFYDSILSATDILGADMNAVKTNLENAVISIGKINLKGLSGDEIQEKLEAVFGAAADSLAKQAFGSLEDFQTVGEGYFETLVKVASAVEEAAYYTDRLNVTAINYTNIVNKQAEDLATEIVRQSYLTKVGISTVKGGMTDLVNSFDGTAEEITDFISTLEDLQEQLFMTGKSGNYLTSSMILGAGGLDKLSSGLDAYFEMLSPAEQAAELTRRLTKEFAIFGKELPSNVKSFRDLVNSIDVSTEAEQKLYGQIITLAPEFNDLQDALDSANSATNALVQSLRDLAEQARAARGETEQPRNLDYLRNEFNKASALAAQGDTEAANRLLSLGKDLMSVSKIYAQSSTDYAKDLALIQRATTVAADLQANGLGVDNTSLNPANGTTTTPTVNTTNTTMSSEMKQMREEFNAGILAVAKFVQKLDARTERWDDGDRMMVGIAPEIDDVPLNVKVVT